MTNGGTEVNDISVRIPFDSDVFTPERKEELITRVNYCGDKGQWLSTLDLDQILEIVKEQDGGQTFHTYSPVDREDLPFFANDVKIEKVDISSRILVIPLCDGSHFNGYVVNFEKNEIVKIDAMNPAAGETTTFKALRNELFDLTDEVTCVLCVLRTLARKSWKKTQLCHMVMLQSPHPSRAHIFVHALTGSQH